MYTVFFRVNCIPEYLLYMYAVFVVHQSNKLVIILILCSAASAANYIYCTKTEFQRCFSQCVLVLGKCDSMSTYVCLDYTALSKGRITNIDASPSSDSAHPPENALGGRSSSSSYQADSSQIYVYYRIDIEPSMSLKVTTFEFNSKNVDQISVSLIKDGVPSLHNQVCCSQSVLGWIM